MSTWRLTRQQTDGRCTHRSVGCNAAPFQGDRSRASGPYPHLTYRCAPPLDLQVRALGIFEHSGV